MRQPLTPSIASSLHHHNIVSTSIRKLNMSDLLAMLSLDLLLEILYKLPLKSLLMLKCVCKSLNSIISDPKFAKDHFRLSQTRDYHLLICPWGFSKEREFNLFDSRYLSVFDNSTTRTTIIPETMLKFPLTPSNNCVVITDSCNDIICFESMDHNKIIGDLVVWNPCTNKFKILPPLENIPHGMIPTLYSIGYDGFIDNYKVVAVSSSFKFFETQYHYKVCNTQVMIHTLGTNFWRSIPDFPHGFFDNYKEIIGKFVSGTINWMIKDQENETSWVILSLDLGNESYQEIPYPTFDIDDPLHNFSLGVFRDCLCIHAQTEYFLDIWVMKDYGNKDSWTKLFNIPLAKSGNYFGFCLVGLHYISEEDDQVFLHFSSKVYVYSNKNGTIKTLNIQGLPSTFTSNVYVESLISP